MKSIFTDDIYWTGLGVFVLLPFGANLLLHHSINWYSLCICIALYTAVIWYLSKQRI